MDILHLRDVFFKAILPCNRAEEHIHDFGSPCKGWLFGCLIFFFFDVLIERGPSKNYFVTKINMTILPRLVLNYKGLVHDSQTEKKETDINWFNASNWKKFGLDCQNNFFKTENPFYLTLFSGSFLSISFNN